MDLTPYIASLREDLTTAASAGDEQTRRVAAMLAAALEPSVRLALMNALSDLAAEVTAHLDEHVVDVRLDGRDLKVVVTPTGHPAPESDAPPPPPPTGGSGAEGGDISRITLRLFEELKAKAEQAASAQGVSLNTFVQQAVQGALHRAQAGDKEAWRAATHQWKRQWQQGPGGGPGGAGGGRMHGWVQGR